tara:strand:- start:1384 stop:1737 length:354 start_codon:yes stop_codon:yes gene_type:complete
MVSKDRVEKAAQEYLRALISTTPAKVVVKAILLGDSGGFTSEELAEIATGRNTSKAKNSDPNFRTDKIPLPKKQTRKVSRYQRVFGKHLKALKKKHPRTDISVLMKKAHRLTKRELK